MWNVLAFFIQLCWRASARAGFVLWEKTYEFLKILRFFSYSSWLRSRLNLLRVTSREGHDLIVHPGKMGWNTVDHGRGCISGRSPTCRLNRGTSCLFVRPEQIFQLLSPSSNPKTIRWRANPPPAGCRSRPNGARPSGPTGAPRQGGCASA